MRKTYGELPAVRSLAPPLKHRYSVCYDACYRRQPRPEDELTKAPEILTAGVMQQDRAQHNSHEVKGGASPRMCGKGAPVIEPGTNKAR